MSTTTVDLDRVDRRINQLVPHSDCLDPVSQAIAEVRTGTSLELQQVPVVEDCPWGVLTAGIFTKAADLPHYRWPALDAATKAMRQIIAEREAASVIARFNASLTDLAIDPAQPLSPVQSAVLRAWLQAQE